MPANFLHPVFAYLVNRWKPSFSLPGLLVGSIIPDVEVIPIYYLTNGEIDRLFFHSIVGAVTLGTILSLFLVIFIYPNFVSAIFRIDVKEMLKENLRCSAKIWQPVQTCATRQERKGQPVPARGSKQAKRNAKGEGHLLLPRGDAGLCLPGTKSHEEGDKISDLSTGG